MRFPYLLLAGALALPLAAGLAGCGTPSTPGDQPVTLPASAEARDSMQANLIAPVPDVSSTVADSAAARSAATPR